MLKKNKLSFIFLFLFSVLITGCQKKDDDQVITQKISIHTKNNSVKSLNNVSNQKTNKTEYENLMLVNKENKIPVDFIPNLTDVGNGFKFNKNAAQYLTAMLGDANKDGINLFIISSYRSTERQSQNFNNNINKLKALGLSEQDAYNETAKYFAKPGFSEHSIGLAVDLNSLEETFENTKEFNWLQNNAANYGFILRYPKDKEDVTKIAYEPWHYRYVGKKHALIITSKHLTLEEYLQNINNNK